MNQVGFYPQAPKQAAVINISDTGGFSIITADKSRTVYRGKLSTEQQSKNSSLVVRIADFSTFTTPGTYCLVVGNWK